MTEKKRAADRSLQPWIDSNIAYFPEVGHINSEA